MGFLEQVENFIGKIDNFLGGYVLVFLLLGIGIYFTIRLGFVQFAKFGRSFKLMFGGIFNKEKSEGALSSFQALSTAVAAQVGTGNIGGVATAVTIGGPGAVLWMWITALLGMSTIFAEAVLAQFYRERTEDGELVGGPAFYIRKGVGAKSKGLAKFLAGFFAVAIIIALGFAGNMVQSNSISAALNTSFGIPTWVVGLILAIIAGLIFIGGIKRIGRFAELVVPFMAIIYIITTIILLIKYGSNLGHAFGLIFEGAFTPQAAVGGFAGAAVRQAIKLGVQRGLFSNEAGMGSTPHAHAVADVKHPGQQGLVAMAGVFIDTILICSGTALAIVATGSYEAYEKGVTEGVGITQLAFTRAFGNVGGAFLSICLMFFAFTTIVGWYYFGESNVRYLFGKKGLLPYQILVLVFIFAGSLAQVSFVWTLNGFLNNLMVIPNVIALAILSPLVVKIYKDYNKQYKLGHFDFKYDETRHTDL